MTSVVRPAMSRSSASSRSVLGVGVERAGGLVEDEDGRVLEQRARDREALALAAGERGAALADDGVVAVGQAADEVVRVGGSGGRLDLARVAPGRP